MEIYEALRKDHDAVKALLAELVSLDESDVKTRDSLVAKIRDELVPHSRAEEAVFYNSLRLLDASSGMAMHGFAEHMEAEALLRSLQARDFIGTTWKPTAEKLKNWLDQHIEEEEGDMFAAAKQLFTYREAQAMAEAFEKMKPEVKEGGLINSSVEMIANLMPPQFADRFRNFDSNQNK
jgi:hemerythrin superfamily protein